MREKIGKDLKDLFDGRCLGKMHIDLKGLVLLSERETLAIIIETSFFKCGIITESSLVTNQPNSAQVHHINFFQCS
jgi:hypothetical protein